jgi:arginase
VAYTSRRGLLLGAASLGAIYVLGGQALSQTRGARPVSLILAPSNLGMRPNGNGSEPGAWRAPEALMAAGLRTQLRVRDVLALPRPHYEPGEQPGTQIRNGAAIRAFSVKLAHAVRMAAATGRFPLVIGGDCSVMLGGLYGERLAGGRGLVHIDGHSDFANPANSKTVPRSAAGMDLALATGRGERLVTDWPKIDGPLVRDEDAVQIGERGLLNGIPQYYPDIADTNITRLYAPDVEAMGVEAAAARAIERLRAQGLDRAWLHLDLDVLDQAVMPAVDSPGTPGLDFAQMSALVGALVASGRIAGADVTIYDPDRDPQRAYARPIVEALGEAFGRLAARSPHARSAASHPRTGAVSR